MGRLGMVGFAVPVAVYDPPLPIFSAVDVRDPQRVRSRRQTLHGRRRVLVGNRVGEITTRTGRDQFDLVRRAVGETRRQPPEGAADIFPTAFGHRRTEQGHRVVLDHIASRGLGSPLWIAVSASTCRGIVDARKSAVSLKTVPPTVASDYDRRSRRRGSALEAAIGAAAFVHQG